MITAVEDYFSQGCGRCNRFATPQCSTRLWTAELVELRAICLGSGLKETVKWGHPCYQYAGRNIAIIGTFQQDFRLTFFDAALMQDPFHILEKQGPNTAYAGMIRFNASRVVNTVAAEIHAYLDEAMGYAAAGITAPKVKIVIDMPGELLAAFDGDPDLADAFDRLTPGRQKSYVINLNSTKTPATRIARIAKFRDHIFAGKGATER